MILLITFLAIIAIGITISMVFLAKALYHYTTYLKLKKENQKIYFIKYQSDKTVQKSDNTYISLN